MPLYRSLLPFRTPSRSAARKPAAPSPAGRPAGRKAPPVVAGTVAVRSIMLTIPEDIAELLADRLEEATADEGPHGINLTTRQYSQILHALFPEQYATRPPLIDDRCILPSADPVGTEERLRLYARRAAAGIELHHPADAKGDLLGRKNILLGGFRNQRDHVNIVGWQEPDDDGEPVGEDP